MEKPSRAWSLITIDVETRQYAGNLGYDDDPRHTYRYDASVPNHKQLSVGDLVFIRDRKQLIGVARVSKIYIATKEKTRYRCPICADTALKVRKTIFPNWRCSKGHQFDTPNAEVILIASYEAHYSDSFVETPDAISVPHIKQAALRPNDQLSIEELDLSQIDKMLTDKFPAIRNLLSNFLDESVIGPYDAIEPNSERPLLDLDSDFISSMTGTRETVLKAIKLRRGQKSFRDKLIKTYGSCMVTNCEIVDVLEAAHIDPYRGISDNHLENGLLLRADIHTLFDLNLMAIDPSDMTLCFHPRVIHAGYGGFEGLQLRTVKDVNPALEPLRRRWDTFSKRSRLP